MAFFRYGGRKNILRDRFCARFHLFMPILIALMFWGGTDETPSASLLILVSSTGLAHSGYKDDFEKEFLTNLGLEPNLRSACIECHVSDKMDY